MMNDARPKLLVVDDEVDFADFVHDLAERNGFEVATAGNGEKAKSSFDQFQPDVIVLDVIMPQADGIEFIEWLGSNGHNVRLIVVTGFSPDYAMLAEKLAEARGLSSVMVLTKPVRAATLLQALKGDHE
jgi:CheY-like chemotaxis protein